MMGKASSKKSGCIEVGSRVIVKAFHVTCMSKFSRRYGSACKTKLLISVVCKRTGDKLPSDHLHMSVHVRFNLEGGVLRCPILISDPVYLFLVLYWLPISYISLLLLHMLIRLLIRLEEKWVQSLMLTTTNNENLQEVEGEEVEIIIKAPRNTSRNPKIRNDINCNGVRWVENNSETKRD